jgi:hypothetical protein
MGRALYPSRVIRFCECRVWSSAISSDWMSTFVPSGLCRQTNRPLLHSSIATTNEHSPNQLLNRSMHRGRHPHIAPTLPYLRLPTMYNAHMTHPCSTFVSISVLPVSQL